MTPVDDVPFDPDRMVGAVEIADALHVQRQTVDQWRQRNVGFPDPDYEVGGRPAWRWSAVRAWVIETGRDR